MKVRYGSIALLLMVIVLISAGLTALSGVHRSPETKEDLSVVVSFYPLYTAALNVVGECQGVSVTCLTQPTAGCLHDYQLSPSERAVLGNADVLVLNGGGMESFLESALASLPELTLVDTSASLSLLTCEEHEDEHDHGHDHSVNAHVWIDPARYALQVQTICNELSKADPEHAAAYAQNTAVYLQQIVAIEEELHTVSLPFTHALLFHESMAYAAQTLQLPTLGTIPLGEDEAASAADLAVIADALRGNSVLFLYDDQYTNLYEDLTRYADRSAIIRWNTAVRPIEGIADKDAWLVAMRQNMEAVKEAAT